MPHPFRFEHGAEPALREARTRPSVFGRAPKVLAPVAVASSMAVLACAGVLGIEDAECDPTYSAQCRPIGVAGSGPMQFGGTGGSGTSGSAGGGGTALVPSGNGGGAGASSLMPGNGSGLCNRYCDLVSMNCTDDNEQYASREACLAVCALLEPGVEGDQSGNTVSCRLGRAALAGDTGEPGDYCFSAGPGGAGACGRDCEGYCTLMTAKCGELGDLAQCLDACSDVPDLTTEAPSETFNTSIQSGDSLQCRLFHVSAATLDPTSHCVHAAGIAVCNASP